MINLILAQAAGGELNLINEGLKYGTTGVLVVAIFLTTKMMIGFYKDQVAMLTAFAQEQRTALETAAEVQDQRTKDGLINLNKSIESATAMLQAAKSVTDATSSVVNDCRELIRETKEAAQAVAALRPRAA